MGRSPCCAKVGMKRGAWTALEDKILTAYIKAHGEGSWRNLPKRAGLKRCGKSCRLRWLNYLRPDIKRGNISRDEEELILRLHKLLGNRWSLIAGRLPGRTDNEIKNYWNTTLGKKTGSQVASAPRPKQTRPSPKSKVKKVQAPVSRSPIQSMPLPVTVTRPKVVRAKPTPCNGVLSPQAVIGSEQIQTDQQEDPEFLRQVHHGSNNGLREACTDDHMSFLSAGVDELMASGGCVYNGDVAGPTQTSEAMLGNWIADCGLGEKDTLDLESLAFLLDSDEWS